MSLTDDVLAGDPRAVARAISMVEDGAEGLEALSAELFPRTGRATTVGGARRFRPDFALRSKRRVASRTSCG